MMYPSEWMPAPILMAFSSEKKAVKFARRKCGVHIEPKKTDGWATFLESDDGPAFAIVCVKWYDDAAQRAALLAHECVHVAKRWGEMMGDEPSEEWLAYAVQSAFLTCVEQLGASWLR